MSQSSKKHKRQPDRLDHERRQLARAIVHKVNHAVKSDGSKRQLGEVLDSNPLTIRLLGSSLTLTDAEVDLSSSAVAYENTIGIEEGDTAVLMELNGYWVVMDIIGDDDTLEYKS